MKYTELKKTFFRSGGKRFSDFTRKTESGAVIRALAFSARAEIEEKNVYMQFLGTLKAGIIYPQFTEREISDFADFNPQLAAKLYLEIKALTSQADAALCGNAGQAELERRFFGKEQ